MEYAQSLLSWFTAESQVAAADGSPAAQQSSHLPPPDFLSRVRRNRRSQLRQATPTGGEPLTPLELRLRDLVLDLYSDQTSSSSAGITRGSESEELSEIDSGHFSDRPATSEPLFHSPYPLTMATSEPPKTTPLHSYTDTARPDEQEPSPLLPSFSADDIAQVTQDPSLPSLSSTSNFQFGARQPMAGLPGLPPSLPASPYGVRSPYAPPPASLPLYSYTEPSLSSKPPPKNNAPSDLRSLVTRSFQLPPSSLPNTSQQKLSKAPLATPSPVLATPPKPQATPTDQQATPTEQQATPPSSLSHSADTPKDDERDEVDSVAEPAQPLERDSAAASTEESSGMKIGRQDSQTGSAPEERKALPYNPGGRLLEIQSPLSPREIRDRLADVVQGKPSQASGVSFSIPAPLGELLSLPVEGERDGEEGESENGAGDKLKDLHNFEDAETSSVVSIEQITEALRQDPPQPLSLPLSFPPPSPSLRDREKTPTQDSSSHHAFSLPLSSSPFPATRTATRPSKYSKPATPPPSRMPEHLLPAHKKQQQQQQQQQKQQQTLSSDPAPSSPRPPPSSETTQRTSYLPPPPPPLPDSSSDQQLSKVLHTKAHLEGQLEAVTEECRQLLRERAALNSRLAVAEAELEVARRERKISGTTGSGERSENSVQLREQLETSQRELRQERKTLETVRDDLNRATAGERRLKQEVEEEKKKGVVLAGRVRELGDQLRDSGRELQEEKVSREEAQHQLRSLQSSYQAVEESKEWMQTQLQETLDEKRKLTEELRASKAESIASTVKIDQLSRENSSFQQHITNLQKGVLQDKARLVSDLEAIEADVLSREDSYARLVAEKAQLEELAQQRAQEIERLSAEVGETRVERDELREREKERVGREENLAGQCQVLQTAKREVEKRLREMEAELAAREEEVEKLRRGRGGLQERLREAEVALVGKDGALQGARDSQEVLRTELEMLRQTQVKVEGELEEERRQVARLEATLWASQEGTGGGQDLVKSLQDIQQQLETENRTLRERLADGEVELRERERELEAVQSRGKDSASRLRDLERKLTVANSECVTLKQSLTEREASVTRLTRESEADRQELEGVRSERDHIQTKLNAALQQKSRLEGQLLEQSTLGELEQLQVAVRERSSLRKELEMTKLSHQQQLLQITARESQKEAELKTAKREVERSQTQLEKMATALEEMETKLAELRSQMKREVEEVKREVGRERRGREEAERDATSLRMELEELQKQSLWLQKETEEMRGKLVHESAQKGEVERASGMVALKLKQNAEEKERHLREENQTLSLELEQLRGRLAGISVTQQALKTHAGQLESALAERESSLTRLTAEVERLEREKRSREGQVHTETTALKEEVFSLQSQLVETRKLLGQEQNRANELTEELRKTSAELSEIRNDRSSEERSLPALEAKVSRLTRSRDELRLELSSVRAELVVAKTATETAERELENRKTQLEILQQKMSVTEDQRRGWEREMEELRARLQVVEEGGRRGERRALFETSLSSIGGDEETDNAAPALHGETSNAVSNESVISLSPPHPQTLSVCHPTATPSLLLLLLLLTSPCTQTS